MKQSGKHVDYYEKYCSKCKHRDLGETDSPCKECSDKFFDDWRNPNRTFIYFEKEECILVRSVKEATDEEIQKVLKGETNET